MISSVLGLLQLVIVVDVIASWLVPDRRGFPRSLTSPITEPLYGVVHRFLDPRRTGNLDFAPLIWILVVSGVAGRLRMMGL